jgi:hypothetical protein
MTVYRVTSEGHADYLTTSRKDAERHNATEEDGQGTICVERWSPSELRALPEWDG